jgi:hypothetical protein
MSNPLIFAALCMSLFFIFFSNISKTVFRPNDLWFCREFQALPFDNKKGFYHRNNRGEILKILRQPLFLGDPLKQFYYAFTLKTIFHRFCNHNIIFCFILWCKIVWIHFNECNGSCFLKQCQIWIFVKKTFIRLLNINHFQMLLVVKKTNLISSTYISFLTFRSISVVQDRYHLLIKLFFLHTLISKRKRKKRNILLMGDIFMINIRSLN